MDISVSIDHKGNELGFQLSVMPKCRTTYKYGKSESNNYIVRCLEVWWLVFYINISLIIKKQEQKDECSRKNGCYKVNT